ncbi:cation transporter [Candidatus Bathyarchaeota archaeon]|nr:cation transporter [Candidatus Bathyarchaeota archaeon]NIU80896.1 cation transporter [Candidatus Bathyarchaeota archaeon]NIV67546.1 cation transporter [Candidatus Bathyarchaeota archaeon]NIW34171.1 cation transporter [Candidatus Bathyarchaeota archaeon]
MLVWIGEAWNGLEAGVALWSAVTAGSVALLAFGLDSLIEIFAGAVLIWRLGREGREREEEAAERRALRMVGITFFLLVAYILVQSSATFVGWLPEPRESYVGIALVISSALVMTVLFWAKSRIARRLGSRALRAEAVESLICDLQDMTVLLGLGLNALYGWWWADPIAALALIPLLLKEGWDAILPEKDGP